MYTIPVLRNALLPTCGFVCLLLLGIGCGDSVECVVDTDCALGNRCEAQMCVDLSSLPDRDTGPAVDGAVDDAGAEDTGSGEIDSGPGDSGSDGGMDAGSLFACDFDGTYLPTESPSNPAGCLALAQCVVVTTGASTNVDCDTVSSDCSYDASCVCTGTTGTVTIVADFPNGTFESSASGTTCAYTLSAS